MQAQLIALDWGTTSLRAYLLGVAGQVLNMRTMACGIMQLTSAPRVIAGAWCTDNFELAFDQACGDWLASNPGISVIACGMIGSAQGWREVPYLPTPATLASLCDGLYSVRSVHGVDVHIVPGVIEYSALPNVMRGEETQVLGVLHSHKHLNHCLIGLPGSHSKWVQTVDGCLMHFDTFMTGELFAAACEHTILGRTQRPCEQFEQAAFERGVHVALSPEGRLGPLSTLFSARTLGLTGQLSAQQQADYVSGLLIGHEIAALRGAVLAEQGEHPIPDIMLIGNEQLCERYRLALSAGGFTHVTRAEHATEHGLWHLAQAAGLLLHPELEG